LYRRVPPLSQSQEKYAMNAKFAKRVIASAFVIMFFSATGNIVCSYAYSCIQSKRALPIKSTDQGVEICVIALRARAMPAPILPEQIECELEVGFPLFCLHSTWIVQDDFSLPRPIYTYPGFISDGIVSLRPRLIYLFINSVFWSLIAVLFGLGAKILKRAWQRKQRLRNKLCIICGYAAGSGVERCPECGFDAVRENKLS